MSSKRISSNWKRMHFSLPVGFGFFFQNRRTKYLILFFQTIISSLSFATFAVERNLPQNRLQLAFTLTLTGVTFRFVTNQQLPKISYLTRLVRKQSIKTRFKKKWYLLLRRESFKTERLYVWERFWFQDKYILYCMVFNYLVTAWHAIVTLISDDGTQADCDLYFFIGFAVFYALFHVFFYVISLKTVSYSIPLIQIDWPLYFYNSIFIVFFILFDFFLHFFIV